MLIYCIYYNLICNLMDAWVSFGSVILDFVKFLVTRMDTSHAIHFNEQAPPSQFVGGGGAEALFVSFINLQPCYEEGCYSQNVFAWYSYVWHVANKDLYLYGRHWAAGLSLPRVLPFECRDTLATAVVLGHKNLQFSVGIVCFLQTIPKAWK